MERVEAFPPLGCDHELPFGDLIGGWLQLPKEKLQETIKAPNVLDAFCHELLTLWVSICAPSLTLELRIASLQGSLPKRSPRERYLYFISQVMGDRQKLSEFFSEYALIKKYLDLTYFQWIERIEELFSRLDQDEEQLAAHFGNGVPLGNIGGNIEKISTHLSDPHLGGRRVYKLEFETRGVSIYYKPKNLKGAKLFNELLGKINESGISPQLKAYRILDRGNYGWVESIETQECRSLEEVSLYFERGGMLLCLMYLLRGYDFHWENVICSGPSPFLIDLETLFSCDHQGSERATEHSVLSTGLIGAYVDFSIASTSIDMSGLGTTNHSVRVQQLTYKNLGTSDLQLTYHSEPLSEDKNSVKVEDYVEEMIRGFTKLYHFAIEHKALFLKEGGFLDQFGTSPFRYINFPTYIYARLLERLTDPTLLRSQEAAEKELEILKQLSYPKVQSSLWLFDVEKHSLLERDVPCFTFCPDSKALGVGGERFEDFFLEAPLESVRKRIGTLSNDDLELQLTFIQGVLGRTSLQQERKSDRAESFFHEAVRIGERVLSEGIRTKDGRLVWISLSPAKSPNRRQYKGIEDDLYGGSTGIALFFSALFATTGDEKWKQASWDAQFHLLEDVALERGKWLPGAIGIGGFAGVGGIIYSLTLSGHLLKEETWIEKALLLASRIEKNHLIEDSVYDIIGGAAGLILSLLPLYQHTRKDFLLEIAQACGEHLLVNMTKDEEGSVGWKGVADQPVWGFSHGNAGIALSLAKLGHYLEDPSYVQTANRAIKAESRAYSEALHNWPDLREGPQNNTLSWCHGAAGIGHSRLALKHLVNLEEVDLDLKRAVEATRERIVGEVAGYCCGDFGRIDFLHSASQYLGDRALEADVKKITSSLIERAIESCDFCPTLMKGLSGVGYTLLRLSDHEQKIPNVFLLDSMNLA